MAGAVNCEERASALRGELEWAAEELDAARQALVEHGCTDDNLRNVERAAENARGAARRDRGAVGRGTRDTEGATCSASLVGVGGDILRCRLHAGHEGSHRDQATTAEWLAFAHPASRMERALEVAMRSPALVAAPVECEPGWLPDVLQRPRRRWWRVR